MLKSFKKNNVKPGKISIQSARINLFRNIHSAIKGIKTPDIPKKILASIKKDVLKHARSFPQDKIMEKMTNFSLNDLLQVTKNIMDDTEIDFHSLIKQVLEKEKKKKVETDIAISPHETKRIVLNIFFEENPTWKEKNLGELLDILSNDKKKTNIPENDVIMLSQLFLFLDKNPPLPIPLQLIQKFLLESEFTPNTDQDERVFVKKNGFNLLKQAIEEGKDLKSIQPLLYLMSERNRKYYRVRFFNIDQIKEMIEIYEENPFKLDVVLRDFMLNREIKLIDVEGNLIPKPVKDLKKTNKPTIKISNFVDKPFLYMIIRPWINNLKEIHISTSFEPYVNKLLYVDKDNVNWFSPSAKFYEDCTKKTEQKENILIIDDRQIIIKYILYSGKHFLQNESIYKIEQAYFQSNATYSLTFLEKASRVIPISLLTDEYIKNLTMMGHQIIKSGLSKILTSQKFNLDIMSDQILKPILINSSTINEFFLNVFNVVKRFDSSVCMIADYHRVYHDRIKRFFYKLDSLYQLPDKYCWFEKKYLNNYETLITDSKNYFISKNLFNFRARLFRFQRITEKINVPLLIYNIPYPIDKITPDSMYQVSTSDLRTIATLIMNDGSPEKDILTFFDFDYIYYRDNIEIFVGYPLYYIEDKNTINIDKEETEDDKIDFAYFWQQFEDRIKELEQHSANDHPMLVQLNEGEVNLKQEDEEEEKTNDNPYDSEEEDNDFYEGFPDLHEESDI